MLQYAHATQSCTYLLYKPIVLHTHTDWDSTWANTHTRIEHSLAHTICKKRSFYTHRDRYIAAHANTHTHTMHTWSVQRSSYTHAHRDRNSASEHAHATQVCTHVSSTAVYLHTHTHTFKHSIACQCTRSDNNAMNLPNFCDFAPTYTQIQRESIPMQNKTQ